MPVPVPGPWPATNAKDATHEEYMRALRWTVRSAGYGRDMTVTITSPDGLHRTTHASMRAASAAALEYTNRTLIPQE
ncbi:hypothetical protein GCM10017784_35330 [Deinococcus indicus]|uniref:hypothetical protein n=1 Tax=Deinococcus indicus TaxID=223556 RepID=UPI00174DCB99|nr:hypothetical protein [Deinococcus indicus]GHG37798.1 hypothetical protein GCM10017784_35330 [Deinococcus indicus]